ncbi:hypothetical protein [Flavobacterium sp.]|nr:hypothetical protein [Flavobacterium sp.]
MKKLLLMLFSLSLLASCAPHRMSCGARGICESNTKVVVGNS